ncbi:DUF2180 family protein [Streptomyces sp. AS58]|uniref:DUF2180 family protein n=1 Tax=Streptomyces sp. AS58 TaxID=1519489 RepID=UPI00099B79F6|nr:DUF2180 family protein [Streptomyces sp. AS58]
MNCYECVVGAGPVRAAVGICRECGAGLCTEHLRIETVEMHRPAGMGKSTSDLPARRMVCPVCASSEATVPGPI